MTDPPIDERQPTASGRVILDRMEELALSIAELERRTPLTKNTISNAIYGPRQPQRKTFEILATALDLPPDALTRPPRAADAAEAPAATTGHFHRWLLRAGNGSLWFGVAGCTVTAFLLARAPDATALTALSPWVHGLHFAVILVLLTRLPRPWARSATWPADRPPDPIAEAAASDFRRYWGGAWMFWLFLYLALTAAATQGMLPSADIPHTSSGRWLVVVLNLLQNSATVLLLRAYEVLARPTLEADLTRKQVLPAEAWLAFAVLLPLLEAGVVLAGWSWDVQQWFGWFSGFAQGTSLALLVGRLDSKYIDPPPLTVALLYIYAVIQGAWPVFQSHHELMLALTFLALVLKCLLFLFVAWLFDSHVLLFYLEKVRQLDEGVRRERQHYLDAMSTDR